MTDQPEPTPAPDDVQAARWARREPLLHLLGRLQRGTLLPAERPLLRAAVEAELADGDQAHVNLTEASNAAWSATIHRDRAIDRLRKARQQRNDAQREAANWKTEAEAMDARRARLARNHDARRVDLADALGQRPEFDWPALLASVRSTRDALADARAAAEPDYRRRAIADALDMAGTRATWPELVAEVQRTHNMRNSFRDRTEAAEQQVRQLTARMTKYADRAITNGQRADQAEATIERMKRTNRMVNGGAREERERAETAEALLAAVRRFADDMAGWCSPHGIAADYAERLRAVLDAKPAAADPDEPIPYTLTEAAVSPDESVQINGVKYHDAATAQAAGVKVPGAERPVTVTVHAELTREQVETAVRRAIRAGRIDPAAYCRLPHEMEA